MLPKGVTRNTSKGNVYYRYRRQGINYTFKAAPGTIEFLAEYDAITQGRPAPGKATEKPGSFSSLLARYYKSPLYLDLKSGTQRTYRLILEKFRDKFGDEAVIAFRPRHLRALTAKMSDRPMAANNMIKRLRVVFSYAQDLDMRDDNPCDGIRMYKKKGRGHHTWTEDEIHVFEDHFPVGTSARLALDLLIYTAQRRSDAVTMGWQLVKGNVISVRQVKGDAFVQIPLHPQLIQSLEHTKGNMTFLLSAHGKPFSPDGFGNRMRKWCDEVGLTNCSAHGLRKAASRRLAEAGCTDREIMAVTGHSSVSEVTRYTEEANRRTMAAAAVGKLEKVKG